MATAKTTTLTFRIEPGLKEAMRAAAVREHRSIANMVDGVDSGLLRAERHFHPGAGRTSRHKQVDSRPPFPEPITAGLPMTDANKTIADSLSRASASAVHAGVRSRERRQCRASTPKDPRCARGSK